MDFNINFGTDTTTDTKYDALCEFVGETVALVTEESVFTAVLIEADTKPAPFVKIKYAINDEELGIPSIIVRQILVENVLGFSLLS